MTRIVNTFPFASQGSVRRFGIVLAALAGVLAWTSTVSAQAADTAHSGDVLFRQKCAMCHSVTPGGRSGIGPNLADIVGRKAGSLTGYSYSPAMRSSSLIWKQDSLERFMASPRTVVPNTRMSVFVGDEAQRRAIASYLAAR